MIAIINFIVLLVSGVLILAFYVASVSPAQLEKKYGANIYKTCGLLRTISGTFMFVAFVNYIVYYFFPLPISLPRYFPWHHGVSVLIGILILIPSAFLMFKGIIDAGDETMRPDKSHTLYKGIYKKVRHPQAVGELIMWFPFAFFVHSPFLVIFSLVWIPVWYMMCLAEEKDLVIRYGESFVEYKKMTGMFFPKR